MVNVLANGCEHVANGSEHVVNRISNNTVNMNIYQMVANYLEQIANR